ncbi:MAG: metal ABC transporter permease [Betaproteobacteria bacterium]|nr:metal ABC transporter permease [Betaproteobacteria bacterium]
MNAAGLELSILGPAFAAGLLVLATHVPLGIRVLQRGIVFIDLAIAQIAALGVIAADLAGFEPQGIGVQVAAVGAALLGGALLTWTEQRWPEVQEALIGVLFVLAATGSILLLAGNPHGGEHLKDLLVGQILWVSQSQLAAVALLTAAVLGLMYGLKARLGRMGFYLLFAVSVTASVQLVGIYLVFASLIVPALAIRNRGHARIATGYGLGALGYGGGLVLSAWFDLPSGAVVVWAMTLLAAVYFGLTARPREADPR